MGRAEQAFRGGKFWSANPSCAKRETSRRRPPAVARDPAEWGC